MMRTLSALSFAAASLSGLSLVGLTRSTVPEPAPLVEPVALSKHDRIDHGFTRRWEPINTAAPTIELRYVVNDRRDDDVVSAGPATDSKPQHPSRSRRIVTLAKRGGDLCARHNMRKQVTNGGRSWRCRRV